MLMSCLKTLAARVMFYATRVEHLEARLALLATRHAIIKAKPSGFRGVLQYL